MFNKEKKDLFLRESILKLAIDFYGGKIDLEKFKNRLDGVIHTANELYNYD